MGTLADFVEACEDFEDVQQLARLSADEMKAVLEGYPALLKDGSKTAGRKQREKLLSEHERMVGGAQCERVCARNNEAIPEGVPAVPPTEPGERAHPCKIHTAHVQGLFYQETRVLL
jgi:hypothetical protein